MAGLRAHAEPAVAAAVEAWAQHVGYRLIDGHTDFATAPVLQEAPAIFAGLLRHCVAAAAAARAAGGRLRPGDSPVAAVADAAAATARGWLPPARHAAFDELLAEARIGLGRIVALHYRPSTLHRIH